MDPTAPPHPEPAPDASDSAAQADDPTERPTASAKAIELALLGAVVALVLIRADGSPDASAMGSVSTAMHESGAPATPSPARAPPEFVWPTAEPVAAAAASPPADVCAPGSTDAAPDEEAFARSHAASGRRARERLLATLEASADDRLRILGLVMQRDADVAAATLPAAILGETCGRDTACARRAAESLAEASRAAAGPKTEAIARLASASRDPTAYGLAIDACASDMAAVAPSCRLVSAEQWARLDADNAVPWLHIASAAASRRDAAAVADAYHRAAHARSNRLHGGAFHDLLNASLPVDLGTSERMQALALAATAIASSWTLPDYMPALEFCSPRAVLDSNRAQSCDGLATQLTDKAGTLVDLAVGIRLAEQLGWPEERIEDLRRQHDALSRVQVEAWAETEPRNCSELAAAAEQGARLARLGEIGALREAVALSGKSIEQLAAEERAARPVRVAEQRARSGAAN